MKGEQQPLELEGPCPICRTCGKKHLFNICVSHVPKYKHDFKHVASVGVAWNAYHVFECRLCSMECTITKKLFRGSGLYLAGLRLKRAMAKFPSAHDFAVDRRGATARSIAASRVRTQDD